AGAVAEAGTLWRRGARPQTASHAPAGHSTGRGVQRVHAPRPGRPLENNGPRPGNLGRAELGDPAQPPLSSTSVCRGGDPGELRLFADQAGVHALGRHSGRGRGPGLGRGRPRQGGGRASGDGRPLARAPGRSRAVHRPGRQGHRGRRGGGPPPGAPRRRARARHSPPLPPGRPRAAGGHPAGLHRRRGAGGRRGAAAAGQERRARGPAWRRGLERELRFRGLCRRSDGAKAAVVCLCAGDHAREKALRPSPALLFGERRRAQGGRLRTAADPCARECGEGGGEPADRVSRARGRGRPLWMHGGCDRGATRAPRSLRGASRLARIPAAHPFRVPLAAEEWTGQGVLRGGRAGDLARRWRRGDGAGVRHAPAPGPGRRRAARVFSARNCAVRGGGGGAAGRSGTDPGRESRGALLLQRGGSGGALGRRPVRVRRWRACARSGGLATGRPVRVGLSVVCPSHHESQGGRSGPHERAHGAADSARAGAGDELRAAHGQPPGREPRHAGSGAGSGPGRDAGRRPPRGG
ncbi:hypothetical protein H632_c2435p0, partial [Helicosporidium sp. ATCC 50920]